LETFQSFDSLFVFRYAGSGFKDLKFKVSDACALRWMMERFNVSNLALILILFLGFFLAPRTTAFSM
jgi:hypothetical protein